MWFLISDQNDQTPDDQITIIKTLSSPFKVSTINNNATITSTPLQFNSNKLPTSNDNISMFIILVHVSGLYIVVIIYNVL